MAALRNSVVETIAARVVAAKAQLAQGSHGKTRLHALLCPDTELFLKSHVRRIMPAAIAHSVLP
jgi:hypothetical protein